MAQLSKEELERTAKWCSDQFEQGHPGFCDVAEADWVLVEQYPLAKLGSPDDWSKWFASEVKAWADEGDKTRFNDMMNGPILCPVVILERDGVGYVWDGNHRVGASLTRGLTHIPAIVGTPKPAPQAKPKCSLPGM